MMVNPDVDGYTKTLNQRKILHGVLFTLNQYGVEVGNISPKNFSVSDAFIKVTLAVL